MVITATISDALMLVLFIEGIYKVSSWGGFMWHDLHTKIHEQWCTSEISGCKTGIIDVRRLKFT
jgi:hypothetical protein